MSSSAQKTPYIGVLLATVAVGATLQFFLPPSTLIGKFLRGFPFLIAPVVLSLAIAKYAQEKSQLRLVFDTVWSQRIAGISFSIVIIGTITPLFASMSGYPFLPEYFVSDLFKMVWIFLALVLLSFSNHRDFTWIYFSLLLAGAGMLVITSGITPLSEPIQPHPLSIAVIFSLLLIEREKPRMNVQMLLIYFLLATVVVFQSISGEGTAKLLTGTAIAFVATTVAFRKRIMGYGLGLIVWTIITIPILVYGFTDLILLPISGDALHLGESLSRRLNEAQVALFNQPLLNLVAGFGHGGVYAAPSSANLPRNISPQGFVHPIHIGPVLLVFRYGAVGLAFYLTLVGMTIAAVVDLLKGGVSPSTADESRYIRPTFVISTLTLVGFMTRFHAQSSLIDPVFGLVVAVVSFATMLTVNAVLGETASP